MFKYPPVIEEDGKMMTSIRVARRFKELLTELGNNNFNRGLNIVLYTNEEKIRKFIAKKALKKSIKK